MIGPNPESGLSLDELATIATLAGGMLVQSFAAWRYLASQFQRRDDALTAMKAERDAKFEAVREEIARQERDILALRGDMREKLAIIPTIEQIERLIERRVDNRLERLEQSLERLTARLVTPRVNLREFQDDGA